MTEVIIVKNEREAGDIYGRSVADLIKTKPNAVLGLATGSSPLAAYQSLARIVHSEHIDVSQVRGFALDEYLGLPLDHPQSYHSTIHRTVVEPLGLNPDLVHVPGDVLDGAPLSDGERIAAAGPAYDKAIEEAGGIDVRFWALARMGMWASMSRDRHLLPARASKRWLSRRASITPDSLTTTSTRCLRIASRRVSARFSKPATWCCLPSVRARPRLWPKRWRAV